MYIFMNISPIWVSLIPPKHHQQNWIQNQQRSLNSSGLNEQSNLVHFYILHWYFQRNDKANCSRTVLAFCFIGTSTVSYRWLISAVSSPFLSQTRYGGEYVDSSLLQIHSFSLHEVIWIIAILQKKITSSHKRTCVNAQQNIKL